MIAELIEYVLTPCPRSVRAMSYLREAIGIRSRFKRVGAHWTEHIEHCRNVIRKGMERCERRRKAVILGAGLLHDVPLKELSETFEEVVLVDIVHPFFARLRNRRFRNVTRLAADVTASIDGAYWAADDPSLPLAIGTPNLFIGDDRVDFTVSLNLLSQLPCMPMSYLQRRGAHSSATVTEFARGVIQAHIRYLKDLPGRVVLITDYERLKVTLAGAVVERRDLFFGIRLPQWGEEWEWKLAPCPEVDTAHHYFRRVVGIADWK